MVTLNADQKDFMNNQSKAERLRSEMEEIEKKSE